MSKKRRDRDDRPQATNAARIGFELLAVAERTALTLPALVAGYDAAREVAGLPVDTENDHPAVSLANMLDSFRAIARGFIASAATEAVAARSSVDHDPDVAQRLGKVLLECCERLESPLADFILARSMANELLGFQENEVDGASPTLLRVLQTERNVAKALIGDTE